MLAALARHGLQGARDGHGVQPRRDRAGQGALAPRARDDVLGLARRGRAGRGAPRGRPSTGRSPPASPTSASSTPWPTSGWSLRRARAGLRPRRLDGERRRGHVEECWTSASISSRAIDPIWPSAPARAARDRRPGASRSWPPLLLSLTAAATSMAGGPATWWPPIGGGAALWPENSLLASVSLWRSASMRLGARSPHDGGRRSSSPHDPTLEATTTASRTRARPEAQRASPA